MLYYCVVVEVDLRLPMVTLNCTTDYATQLRSINVTWLLNSMVPDDIRDGRYSRVATCNSSIVCGNGSYYNKVYCYIASNYVIELQNERLKMSNLILENQIY